MKPVVHMGVLAASLLALASTGCGNGAGGAIAWGLAAAAVSRAHGGCYASCVPGTTCNTKTGYCDPLPCRGECLPQQQCVEDGLGSRCVPAGQPGGTIEVNPPAASQDTPSP
jgi:hypothetical protein